MGRKSSIPEIPQWPQDMWLLFISEVNSLEHGKPADLLLPAQSDLGVIPALHAEKGQVERKLLFG